MIIGLSLSAGSSPLARGLRGGRPAWCSGGGIIPARAGFTLMWSMLGASSADHPRSRGVYDVVWWDNYDESGSSPLARGLPVQPAGQDAD